MKKSLPFVFISLSLFMGCSSAYLYETEKLSLTIEARGNDAAQPVSANLGIKQRVVLIVPGKGEDMETENDPGEASSVVSYFNYKFEDGEGWSVNDNESTIDTVILTGEAASSLNDAPRVFKEIASVEDEKK